MKWEIKRSYLDYKFIEFYKLNENNPMINLLESLIRNFNHNKSYSELITSKSDEDFERLLLLSDSSKGEDKTSLKLIADEFIEFLKLDQKSWRNNIKIKVFVYGTLKKGYGNHRVMERAGGIYLGKSLVHGYACLNTPWFPYAINDGISSIKGEVYEIEDVNLHYLDELEGVPNLYNRTLTSTSFGSAFIYYIEKSRLSEEIKNNIKQYGYAEEWGKIYGK